MAESSKNLSKFLRLANTKWKEEAQRAKEEGGYENLEDGRYICLITSGELTVSRSDRPMAVFGLKVLEGDFAETEQKKFRTLDGDDALKYFAKEMMTFGYDPEDIIWDPKKEKDEAYIENVLAQIARDQTVVKVRFKTKGDYQNIDFEEVVEDYELPKPKKKSKKDEDEKPKKKVDDDDDEDDDDDDAEEETPKKKAKDVKPSKKKPVDDDEDTDDDDDDDEEEEETPKPKKKPAPEVKKKPVDDDDDDEEEDDDDDEEDDDDEVTLAIGMGVKFKWKGEILEGKIKELSDDDSSLKVKVGSKVYPIKPDKITWVDNDND